jgi:hypothetical protein
MHTTTGEHMTQEALKLALEALENGMKFVWTDPEREAGFVAIDAIKEALAQPDTVQVSPLEFVTRVTGKEEIIGVPVFWAQWPSKELNA